MDQVPIGLMTALPEELERLIAAASIRRTSKLAGFEVIEGEIEGRAVILSRSDAGKVNAATLATLLIQQFHCKALLFSGVAGGLNPNRKVGDLIIARSVLQHDYAAIIDQKFKIYHPGDHCIGERRYALPFTMNEELERHLCTIFSPSQFGTILTGDQFINCEKTRERLFQEFGADAVEMEGGAVAQVAARFGIPWVVIRCLSDLAGRKSHLDFSKFLDEASIKASRVAIHIIKSLSI